MNLFCIIPDFIPGKISVKVNDNYPFFLHEWDIQDSVPLDIHIIGFNELARKAGVTKIEKSHKRLIDRYPVLDNFYKISFSDTFPLDSIVLFLGKNQSLEYVEKIPTARADIVPNDSDYPNNQWGLQKIQPEQAWDKTTGDYKIKIAIVDDGVCIDHCELKTKIWVNQNEIPDDIILKIFDPYFTTKHKSQGKGLGLYYVYNIINTQLNGNITVENTTFKYNDCEYQGSEFKIILKDNHSNLFCYHLPRIPRLCSPPVPL